MPRISRRRFIQRAGQGVAVGLGAQVVTLAGCGDAVDRPTGSYDAIIVGGGTAGAIVATKLQRTGAGRKRILVIEAGGPTAAAIGGTDRPTWLPPERRDVTIFDVPGEYSAVAFQPRGVPYQLAETSFAYQGIGIGGNSMFNGMLFQTNPPAIFDGRWPAGWKWRDVEPFFDRVRARIPVTDTPSHDGVAQNTGPAQILHPLYATRGWVETDTSRPFTGGVYSRPYVAAENGRRAGPVSGYLLSVTHEGVPDPGLEILHLAKAERIELDRDGRVREVVYTRRAALDQSSPGTTGSARLADDGLLILASGALATPRLLLRSGIGPRGREREMLPEGSAPFAIDNPMVGVGVFDHVITLVAWSYDGPVAYEGYDYRDDAAHRADIARWLASGSGPYAQYQPVSILNYAQAGATPDTEIFVNPNGVGAAGGRYDGPRTFAAYAMLLDAGARDLIRLDEHGNVRKPDIYLPQDASGAADTELMTSAVFDMIQLFKTDPHLSIAFGPGSASHPHLDPNDREDVRRYVVSDEPVDGVYFGRLNANHFGGTAPLSEGPGGVDPTSLVLRGTKNVAIVDASLIPTPVAAHPVGTIMAIADRAGDVLAARWK